MTGLIIRTPQEEKQFLEQFAQILLEKYEESRNLAKNKSVDPNHIPYKLNSPEIKAAFPNTSLSTLRKWATQGTIGELANDGKYYVTISEIREALFKK